MNSLAADSEVGETGASKQDQFVREENKLLREKLHSTAMANFNLSAELDKERNSRLERIIRCCRENGVSSLVQGDLKVEFFSPSGPTEIHYSPGVQPLPEQSLVEAIDEENEGEGTFVSEEVREELRLNDLMVNDPAAYEQEMIDAFNSKGEE